MCRQKHGQDLWVEVADTSYLPSTVWVINFEEQHFSLEMILQVPHQTLNVWLKPPILALCHYAPRLHHRLGMSLIPPGSLPGDLATLLHLEALAEPPIFYQVDQVLHDPHLLLVDSLNEVFLGHEYHRVQDLAIGDRSEQPEKQVEDAPGHGPR